MKIEQLIEQVAAIKDELINVSKLIGHMNTHREASISCRSYHVVKFSADELMPHVEKRHRDLTNELAHLTAALDAAEKTAQGWIAAPIKTAQGWIAAPTQVAEDALNEWPGEPPTLSKAKPERLPIGGFDDSLCPGFEEE